MRLLHELRSQRDYQKRLSRQLGGAAALRFRTAMLARRAQLSGRDTLVLEAPGLLHPVALRLSSTDADVYGQVVTDAGYAHAVVPDAEIIVDCGANIGLASAFFLSRMPHARVVAIEPHPANAALCRRNLAPYGARAEVIEGAIWNSSATLSLRASAGDEWGVQVQAGPAGTVRAFDIPSLNLDRIDILKIDIEGAEAVLFDDSARAWLPAVRNIVIELHGAACELALRSALSGYRFDESSSGELTLIRSISPRNDSHRPGPVSTNQR